MKYSANYIYIYKGHPATHWNMIMTLSRSVSKLKVRFSKFFKKFRDHKDTTLTLIKASKVERLVR